MLNISKNSIAQKVEKSRYRSFSMVRDHKAGIVFARLMLALFLVFLILLFLPWTQNIRSRGEVTSLRPDQRPQTIHSVISGRIEKWYVREGQLVRQGDTILHISEIKDQYFDPKLLDRTEQQIKNKEQTVSSYMNKVLALDAQIDALLQTKKLKMEQARNYLQQAMLKVTSDSIEVEAAKINYSIAQEQIKRSEQLYKDGLQSLTELETRKLRLQETQARLISAKNKLLSSQNEVINARVELNSVDNQYRDKLAKAESEKYTALSSMYDAEGEVTKMQTQYMNYSVRTGFYYIVAPQDGYITKAIRVGIGETIKEGEELISIMPANVNLAVEMYVYPMDLPLLELGQPVRLMFDGWPSIVFSGWPNASYGTYGGKVVAIDQFAGANGQYRVLVAPDPDDHPWPGLLRVGSGSVAMTLLKDVPIWYELWRQINGFPPDFYKDLPNSNNPSLKEEEKK